MHIFLDYPQLPLINEEEIVPGKTIAIYPGRFQPFGPHHKKVFEFLRKKFGDAYIVSSNKSDSSRHPLNFKQKKAHMMKMGIPGNKIVQVKNPYQATELTKKLPEDTAVVFAFGKKDKLILENNSLPPGQDFDNWSITNVY